VPLLVEVSLYDVDVVEAIAEYGGEEAAGQGVVLVVR